MSIEKNLTAANKALPSLERAVAILKGHEDAPTDTIAFLAKKANAAKQKGETALKEIQDLRKRLQDLETAAIGYQGAITSYKQDIVELLEKETQE